MEKLLEKARHYCELWKIEFSLEIEGRTWWARFRDRKEENLWYGTHEDPAKAVRSAIEDLERRGR